MLPHISSFHVFLIFGAIWWGGGLILGCRMAYFRWKMWHHFAPGVETWKAFDSRRRYPDSELYTEDGLAYRNKTLRAERTLVYWVIGVALLIAAFVPKH